MKAKIFLSIVAISILLGSCLVNSLHPFYDEESTFFGTVQDKIHLLKS